MYSRYSSFWVGKVTVKYSDQSNSMCISCIYRESCIAVKDLLCYVQWPNIQKSNSDVKLPVCDMLPSKWDTVQNCTQADMFEREDSDITCKY